MIANLRQDAGLPRSRPAKLLKLAVIAPRESVLAIAERIAAVLGNVCD